MPMKVLKNLLLRILTFAVVLRGIAAGADESRNAPTNSPVPRYHIYAGSTHAHTAYSWSHGDQFINTKQDSGEEKVPGISVSPEGVQFPAKSKITKPDWQKFQ